MMTGGGDEMGWNDEISWGDRGRTNRGGFSQENFLLEGGDCGN